MAVRYTKAPAAIEAAPDMAAIIVTVFLVIVFSPLMCLTDIHNREQALIKPVYILLPAGKSSKQGTGVFEGSI